MKSMKIWRLAFAVLAAFSLSSCSSDDGSWDSMIWKAEVPVVTVDGIYDVSDRGGTFTFTCRNYSKPWIESAESGEKYYYPEREKDDYHTISADWFTAKIVGTEFNISFKPNRESNEQFLSVTVTAGDIFYTFKFKQFAHQE